MLLRGTAARRTLPKARAIGNGDLNRAVRWLAKICPAWSLSSFDTVSGSIIPCCDGRASSFNFLCESLPKQPTTTKSHVSKTKSESDKFGLR